MSKCIFYNGSCEIAEELAGQVLPLVTVSKNTCIACMASTPPRAPNRVTYGIAVAGLKREGKPFQDLFDKAVSFSHRGDVIVKVEKNGPGTCLRNLLESIGISEGKDCQCDEYAAQMDIWGVEGCLLRRQEIIEHLNSQSITWFDMAKVALAGYFTTGSLLDECIKRAKGLQDEVQ